MDNCFLNASFLGAYGENNQLFESLLNEFVRDHIYWRRNFHPLDQPPIATTAAYEPEYIDSVARMKQELHLLTARLKSSVPMYNPRYIGHMSSDLLLPGLLAQVITTLYNPNNISEDSAPTTVEMELDVGKQLATMFGFKVDEQQTPCAFGHVTSGGTVANYEGLWLMRAIRYLPLAIKQGCIESGVDLTCPDGERVRNMDSFALVNMGIDDILNLYERVSQLTEQDKIDLINAINANRYEQLGARLFFAKHPNIADGILIVPKTAHYSWVKAMRLLGLGEEQLWQVACDNNMRMDKTALAAILLDAHQQQRPVIGVVAVLGTTEFGTVDPIDGIVALRKDCEKRGQSFAIHVDAAWGGYLTSMFRASNGDFLEDEQVAPNCHYFPSKQTYGAFRALSEVDSITVDPHKLGYIPFGTGAFIVRDNRMSRLVVQKAAYVFGDGDCNDFRQLGQFILEGSKPGASAAAAYVTHKVLPLDAEHFGRLPKLTIRNTEIFFDKLQNLGTRVADKVQLLIPISPDSNLICIAFNPLGNQDINVMNQFNQRFYQTIKADPSKAMQSNEFFGSSTWLYTDKMTTAGFDLFCSTLNMDSRQLAHASQAQGQVSGVFLIRHTLMNPWLSECNNGVTYLDMYCDFIERTIDQMTDNRS